MAKIILLFIDRCFLNLRIASHDENMRKLDEMWNEVKDGPQRDAANISSDFKKVFGDINVSLNHYQEHISEQAN